MALRFSNTAKTFKYIFQGAATSDQTITIPDLTGNMLLDTSVTPHAVVSSPTSQTPALNNMYYPVLFEDDDDVAGGITRRSFSVTVNNSTPAKCTITAASHGLAIGAPVIFSGGSLPTGITAGTVYYIATTNFSANSFEITDLAGFTSNTPASTIVTTSAGSGTCKAAGRLYVPLAGDYEIIYSGVVAAVDNTDTSLDLWFVQGTATDTANNTGGTTVPKSNTQVRTVSTGQRIVLAVAVILDMAVNDFVKINMKTSVGSKITLLANAAATVDGVALPAMPASIISMKRIGG